MLKGNACNTYTVPKQVNLNHINDENYTSFRVDRQSTTEPCLGQGTTHTIKARIPRGVNAHTFNWNISGAAITNGRETRENFISPITKKIPTKIY